jgi:hypothetical protein
MTTYEAVTSSDNRYRDSRCVSLSECAGGITLRYDHSCEDSGEMAGYTVRRSMGYTFGIYHFRRNATDSLHFSALNEYTFDAIDKHKTRELKNGKWLKKGGQAGKVEEQQLCASKVLPSANANIGLGRQAGLRS